MNKEIAQKNVSILHSTSFQVTKTEICQVENSAPEDILRSLPDSQGGSGRHKCVVCAYNEGFVRASEGELITSDEICNHGNSAPSSILESLHDSQAGAGRHKCVICAYATGLKAGSGFSEIISVEDWHLSQKTMLFHEPGEVSPRKRRAVKVDYLAKDIRGRNVGLSGEKLVLDFEKKQLLAADRKDLVERVEHISVTQGDGLGFDILSFTPTGDEKYIEVKTTSGNQKTSFEVSDNEVEFSGEKPDNFYLYRVFNFGVSGKSAEFYVERGSIRDNFELVPSKYRARHL